GERMKLKPHRIGGERSARQSRPLDRAFALLDPLLARPALVVESNDALRLAAHDLALVARHDGLEHVVPAVSAVHVAGTQSTAFEVTELIEHEQRAITGAGVMAVPHAILLLAPGSRDTGASSGGRNPAEQHPIPIHPLGCAMAASLDPG